jgi:tetratricopeptide (TPR) repeat protein
MGKFLAGPLAAKCAGQSVRPRELGLREEALACVEEAVALCRVLVDERPDVFRPDLAMSLNNLASMLIELGRPEDALARAEEASVLRRALAAQRPNVFRPNLAASLINLSAILREVGRREEALANGEEAVMLHRALAVDRRDAFQPDLAMSLSNLAALLSGVGRFEDALARAEEAVVLRRALAAQRPDVFQPNLARSLDSLAGMLGALRRQSAPFSDRSRPCRRSLPNPCPNWSNYICNDVKASERLQITDCWTRCWRRWPGFRQSRINRHNRGENPSGGNIGVRRSPTTRKRSAFKAGRSILAKAFGGELLGRRETELTSLAMVAE